MILALLVVKCKIKSDSGKGLASLSNLHRDIS